jgi:RimJ/RimL family protein N-acetyltransferase
MEPQLRLVPFAASHLDAFAALAEDPAVLRYTRFPDPPQHDFPAQWLARYEEGRRQRSREAFAILDRAESFLGIALAVSIDREAGEAELGYAVVAAARGRGIGTEAVRQLTRWALQEQGLARVTLIIEAANVGSTRLAERCGYTLEGVRRNAYVKPGIRGDTAVYARLRDDPERRG